MQARAAVRVGAGRKAVMSVVASDKKAVCVLTGTAGVEGEGGQTVCRAHSLASFSLWTEDKEKYIPP